MSTTYEERLRAALQTAHPRRRRVDRISRVVAAPLFAFTLLGTAEIVTAPDRQAAAATAAAELAFERTGVDVVWRADAVQHESPNEVDGSPLSIWPVRVRDAAPAAEVLNEAMSVYPPGFAKRLLDKVYVVSSLAVAGKRAGGMSRSHAIYAASNAMQYAASRAATRQTFFHETATLLLDQIAWPRVVFDQDWRSCNEPGFAYWSDRNASSHGEDALAALGMRGAADARMRQAGFLAEYGQASFHADFDTYADAVFTQTDELKTWMADYPRVRRKVALFERVYERADPRFSEVFARLGLGEVAP